jgi:hypothetical protein
VITTEGAAAAGEGVFGQETSLDVLPQGGQVDDEVVRGGQSIWMVDPEDLATAGERVLGKVAGLLALTKGAEEASEVVG